MPQALVMMMKAPQKTQEEEKAVKSLWNFYYADTLSEEAMAFSVRRCLELMESPNTATAVQHPIEDGYVCVKVMGWCRDGRGHFFTEFLADKLDNKEKRRVLAVIHANYPHKQGAVQNPPLKMKKKVAQAMGLPKFFG